MITLLSFVILNMRCTLHTVLFLCMDILVEYMSSWEHLDDSSYIYGITDT